jgi:sugar lactone lactonase YvrE
MVAAAVLIAGLLPVGAASADGHVATLATFDADLGQHPEGVAVDKVGNVYLSMAPLGELWRLAPGASSPERIATIPGVAGSEGFGMLGIAVDAPGNVYIAVHSDVAGGVWRFAPRSGALTHLPGTEAIGLPNDLAFDARGDLFVASSFEGFTTGPDEEALGGVWRITRRGDVEPWLVSPELGGLGLPPLPVPIGANGIAHHRRVLYVTVTEVGRVVAVPIRPDGSAGNPAVMADDPLLVGADGLALDVHGRLYVAVILQSAVHRIGPDGSVTTIATAADGLDFPSTLAFGTGRSERRTLYAANFAIGPQFGFPPGAGPGLLAIRVDTPGLPQP